MRHYTRNTGCERPTLLPVQEHREENSRDAGQENHISPQ